MPALTLLFESHFPAKKPRNKDAIACGSRTNKLGKWKRINRTCIMAGSGRRKVSKQTSRRIFQQISFQAFSRQNHFSGSK
jgi:hypothetical protein